MKISFYDLSKNPTFKTKTTAFCVNCNVYIFPTNCSTLPRNQYFPTSWNYFYYNSISIYKVVSSIFLSETWKNTEYNFVFWLEKFLFLWVSPLFLISEKCKENPQIKMNSFSKQNIDIQFKFDDQTKLLRLLM